MGRLFWKFFVAFWLASVLVGFSIFGLTWLLRWLEPDGKQSYEAERMVLALNSTAAVLGQADVAGARALLGSLVQQGVKPEIYVVDESGRELLGRTLPAADRRDWRLVGDNSYTRVVQPSGHRYVVFARQSEAEAALSKARPMPPPAAIPWIVVLLVSLGIAWRLARHFSRPIRSLRSAIRSMAEGKLDTRVAPIHPRHEDEISELGHDFNRMAQRLQQLVGAQQRLLHDVSHELRSPLARLQAAIGLARQRPDIASLELMLERIERESGRLDSLVGELLTLARLESGAGQIVRETVDLVELVTAIADDARFEAESNERQLVLEGSGEFVTFVGAELLYRAFENVIRNAVKFTQAGSCVTVRLHAGAERFTLEVLDRGPGVDPGLLEDIFQPFHRAGAGGVEGFGLGLAIAQRAVQTHGGEIGASLRDGGGLAVQISLPRTPAPA
ncbi:HAMP domain-containing sensor histidine kinase [Chitinimonas sp.]|uniref:HAMP domain-containing sensor histidine kinase n=1 Tax=Chitinimonas sp. TaxID=1934313 RepID=UPI002F91DE98